MLENQSRRYQTEQAKQKTDVILLRALKIKLAILFVFALAQIAQVFMIGNQCHVVMALSPKGNLFLSDSYTCPIPNVPRVHSIRPEQVDMLL